MATRLLDDNKYMDMNVDSSYIVEWQVYIVNSPSSAQQLTAGKGHTLPPLTKITEHLNENKDILFTCNLTLKGLNKAIFIHYGERCFGEVDSVQFNQQLAQLFFIEVEHETEDFIILHPKSHEEFIKIYSELQTNPELFGKMLNPGMLMVEKILNENIENELEVNKGEHLELNAGLLEVLKILSVNVSTIHNLSFIDSITIKGDSLCQVEPSKLNELPFYMLRNIILHRYNYRELSSKCISLTKSSKTNESTEDIIELLSSDEENVTLHSMDIFLLLFFQCDVLYRQIFAENVAQCQSSLPLITMDPTSNNVMMYDFALRKIMKTCVIDGRVEEFRIMRKSMPIISFIRLESAGRLHSKSKMINHLLGVSHNYFFHREIGGSSTKSYLLPGTVEIGWYLPKKRGNNDLDQHLVFLNLRGNSIIFPKQVSFLQNVSKLIFIYVSLNRMTEQEWQFLNELFSIHGSKYVLLIEEKLNKPNYNIKDLKNQKFDRKNCILLTENISSDKNKIVESINYYTKESPASFSIEKCTGIAKDSRITLESELLQEIDTYPQIIENIFNHSFDKLSNRIAISSLKNDIFKLQGKWWKDWSNGRRYMNRFQTSNEGIEMKVAKIQRDMKESRRNQVEHICSIETSTLTMLSMYLTDDRENMRYSLLFFRFLKIFFEDQALAILPRLYMEYEVSADVIHRDSIENWGIATIKDRLIELEDEISNSSIGEEHIIREFAQIFESTTSVEKSYKNIIRDHHIMDQYKVENLPAMAARFLLAGLPLEILDGDVSQIPITWIKSIFHEIGKIVGVNKKVYIVSILGIQSSGKSTLLNTMFGLLFPVSAGRCTKGAFMQLIPINQSTSELLSYDYIMVVDTEGLKGMEKSNSSSHLHDNELATFSIGLSNLTVININGEDQSDMQDILQITIFALIRMRKVELHPKCIFIHQNVVSDNANEKLITQRNKLVKLLNEMTLAAANQEDLTSKYNRFSDVIGFDPKSDVLYFTGLQQGEPPMASINLGYCLDAEEARRKIILKFKGSLQLYKLNEVGKRIDEVWSSIMKEDFVFHFRNVLELNVTSELEMELAKWESNYTQNLTNWECQQLNLFSNVSGESLENIWTELVPILKEKCDSLCRSQQQELISNFFENHKSKDILKNRQNDIEEYFEITRMKQFTNIYKNFEKIYDSYHHNKFLDKLLNNVENKLLKEIKELYRMHKNQAEQGQFNEEMIAEIFFKKWNELSKDFPTETNKPFDIKQQLQMFFQKSEILRSINLTDKKMLIGETDKYIEIGSKPAFQFKKEFHYSKIRNNIKIMGNSKKNDIRVFLSIVQENCQSLIDSKFTSESNFSENAFKWILDLVDNQFTTRNKENVNNNRRERNYELTINFVHDFAFFQCCKLIPTFEAMQETFLEKNSIRNKVEKKKEQFKTFFFSLWKGVQNEQCAANQLATLVFNSISNSANILMEKNITTVFKEYNKVSTKYELQLNVLIELCEKESFYLYLLYIQDPVEYIKHYLEQQIYNFYTTDQMRNQIMESYNQNVITMITITITAAKEALRKITSENRTNEQNANVIPKDTWKNTFLELIKDDIRNVTNTKLIIFDAYDIKDYNAFIQALSDSLLEMKNEFNAEMPDEYKLFGDEILMGIIQCTECCPYCNELCQRNLVRHEHYCGAFHRPLGLKGIKNGSDELITQPCPNFVKKSGIFQYRKLKIANLDFSEGWLKTTNWKINEKEAIDTHYWIWVMTRFRAEFKEYFEAIHDIPELSLKTKEEILSELSDKLDTINTSNSSHEDDNKKFKFSQMFHKFYYFLFH